MDPAATSVAADKKLAKPKKFAKDFTPDKRRVELEKRVGRREAAKARASTAKLKDERQKVNDHIITARAEADGDMLAQKATHQVFMLSEAGSTQRGVRPRCGNPSGSPWPCRG
jgi:hypothetical protein